jgi:arsenite oxidase small subunit
VNRRDFIQLCATTCAVTQVAELSAQPRPAAGIKRYDRAQLVDASGAPLRPSQLVVDRAYIFHYPFAGTPCFLLNLGRPVRGADNLRTADDRAYQWEGGVGPQQSVVAYSAICAHRLTYPTREISFIGYRDQPTPHSKTAKVIHCCSEHSQYDPAAGARVLAGPASQPLAAIALEHDRATDTVFALGTLGGEMFDEFFAKFEFKLALDHGGQARSRTARTTVVRELTQYCKQQVKC